MVGGSKRVNEALAEAHATLSEDELPHAFHAACRVWSPKMIYDNFSPYLANKSGTKTKRGDPALAKRAAITEALCGNLGWRHHRFMQDADENEKFTKSIDPKWLDLAVELKRS